MGPVRSAKKAPPDDDIRTYEPSDFEFAPGLALCPVGTSECIKSLALTEEAAVLYEEGGLGRLLIEILYGLVALTLCDQCEHDDPPGVDEPPKVVTCTLQTTSFVFAWVEYDDGEHTQPIQKLTWAIKVICCCSERIDEGGPNG